MSVLEKIWSSKDLSDLFLLMDLDGTVVDSDRLHHEAYVAALEPHNIYLSWEDFEAAVHTGVLDETLIKIGVTRQTLLQVKAAKRKWFCELAELPGKLTFVQGAEKFLIDCLNKGANIAIVTNTPSDLVDCMKTRLPSLSLIRNWITREDYTKPKPNTECYELAISRFGRGERFRIGFENTICGLQSVKPCVSYVYFISYKESYSYISASKEDVNVIDSYGKIF